MIKLQHTIVSIKGLRYVQLKSCLLKWPSHQKLASSRKLKRDLWDLSLPCMDLFFLFTAPCSNTSFEDNEISLDMLARENPNEEKPSFPSIRNDAYLMEMHQLTGT